MSKRKFVHRGYGKVEGLGFLFVALLGAGLMAATMGGVFSCGMISWSRYFCWPSALWITLRDSIRDGSTFVAGFWLISFARGHEMRDEHILYGVREGRSARRPFIFVTAISLLLWSAILFGILQLIWLLGTQALAPAPAGLFFCRWLRSHTYIDHDLENVIRQALEDAQVAGKDHLSQTELAARAVQQARPDMTTSEALAAVNLMWRS